MRSVMLALGLGAAAFSMRDRRNRKRFMKWIQPITNIDFQTIVPDKNGLQKMKKRVLKNIA
ncbi:hypothetical protein BTR23_11010 [Alkalihalophilus pseudofirmus]|uniref:hypothetical protein n=1 Tax=Alkalihalobacterium alkalinitrilicum TaxID=427920 RepID=UPI00094D0714|nr:hypothetical protein [Alkalihalobacterium alkalinitrilicum]OLO38785.1 hypothetical protein BTR23_11010 [Alkalihalophilus pseudofirmus]